MKRLFLIASFLIVHCCAELAARADEKSGTLDVYWVDVEGGGATLIVTPAGETVLIDAGNPGVRDPERIHKAATAVAGNVSSTAVSGRRWRQPVRARMTARCSRP